MSGVLILGSGGHGKVVGDILRCQGIEVLGFVDDDPKRWGHSVLDLPVLGAVDTLFQYEPGGLVIGAGSNSIRRQIVERLGEEAAGLWTNVSHPSAIIAGSATLLRGVVVAAGAVVNPGSVIGNHVIVSVNSVVDHNAVVGAYAHLRPGTQVCGGVKVGSGVLIGAGATIIPYHSVGD